MINRSSLLKKILNSKGWVEGTVNEDAVFSYWDLVDAKGVKIKSKIDYFQEILQIYVKIREVCMLF